MGIRRAVITFWSLSVALVCAGGVAGCVPSDTAPVGPGVAVSTPPPPDQQEQRPLATAAAGTWVPGYWHWIGDRWAWVPGHWEHPPRGARGWRAPRYSFHDGQYRYEAGGWVGH